jgi:hypothetical protein
MKAVMFEGANDVIGRPPSTTAEQCDAAIVHRGFDAQMKNWPVLTTCWEPSEEEKEEFIRTGKIYLRLWCDRPPMMSISAWNPVEQKWVINSSPLQPNHPMLMKN